MEEKDKVQFIIDHYNALTKQDLLKRLDVSTYWIRKTIQSLIKEGKITSKSPQGSLDDRKSSEKLQFIIDNHSILSNKEISEKLKESPRWVKRAINTLIKKGDLKPKIVFTEKVLSKSDWLPDVRNRAFELRSRYLKSNNEICQILKKEFDFEISPSSFQFWMDRFCCKGWNKQKWLKKYLPIHRLKKLLNRDYRVLDIQEYISTKYGIYISDDLILVYIKELELINYKFKRLNDINDKINSYSKDWLEEKIYNHISVRALEKEMGVSKTIIMRRLKSEGISLISHRKVWSENMDKLRDLLIDVPPVEGISKEDFNQMVLGWLLGDAHLDPNGRFVVNHSFSQLSYLYVKVRVLKKYMTNVVTVPRNAYDNIYGGKEQMGISCPGLKKYLRFINEDGTKNYEKIMLELKPLGWACYFMDDGSFFSNRQCITIDKKYADSFINRFIFKEKILDGLIEVNNIDPKYIIPGMARKVPNQEVGSFWEPLIPELFDVEIKSDLSLSFVNEYVLDKDPSVMDSVIKYYKKRGFPHFKISDDYLKKELCRLKDLKAEYFWRSEKSIKYISIGNYIFKHFMKHMVQAKYRQVSPMESFNSYYTFLKTLEYSLKHHRTILPDYVHDSLIFFNGGVTGFPCAVAKAVVTKFSNKGDIIVDPCAGWGGRLLGTVASDRYYVGFEPWIKTANELNNIKSFFDFKNVKVINSRFENKYAPDKCALIFTSPPYIDLEIYEEALSKKEWLKLMSDIIRYAEDSLASGGYLILNLPRYLKALLPSTKLIEKNPLYFFTSTRKKDLKKAEILYIWKNK